MSSLPLSDLVRALRHDVVPVVLSGDPAWPVRGVELLDPETDETGESGQLLLGVGLDLHVEADVDAALRIAADTASALAVKCSGELPETVVATARSREVPVVVVGTQVPWSRVQRLASTVLAARPSEGGTDLAGDLFSLANAVAAITGGAIAIMDTEQAILAYSNLPDQPIDDTRRRGILGRRVPEDALPDHLAEKVWRSNRVVRVERPGDLPRLAVVIRAGDDVLGSLWASFPDEEAMAGAEPALAHAANLAALHALALRRKADDEQQRNNLALRTALRHPGNDDADLPFPALLFGLAHLRGGEAVDLLRLLDLFALDARSLGHQPSLALIEQRIYLLLPREPAGAVPVPTLVAHLRDRAAKTVHIEITLVSAPEVGSLAQLRQTKQDVDSALDHLRVARAEPGHYTTGQLRTELVRRRLIEAVRADPMLRTGIGARIARHDRDHGTEYGSTLLTYFRYFGDVTTASATIPIHANTLRQRLRRVRELFDVDPTDPALRLLLEIELAAATEPH